MGLRNCIKTDIKSARARRGRKRARRGRGADMRRFGGRGSIFDGKPCADDVIKLRGPFKAMHKAPSLIVDAPMIITYKRRMKTLQTSTFADWFASLRDTKAKSKIAARIARFEIGLMGDVKSVGDGVSEARIAFGPGYRLYYTVRDGQLIILLIGGDKSSQRRDIAKAKEMAAQI